MAAKDRCRGWKVRGAEPVRELGFELYPEPRVHLLEVDAYADLVGEGSKGIQDRWPRIDEGHVQIERNRSRCHRSSFLQAAPLPPLRQLIGREEVVLSLGLPGGELDVGGLRPCPCSD